MISDSISEQTKNILNSNNIDLIKKKFSEFLTTKNQKFSKMLLYDIIRGTVNREISLDNLVNVIEFLNKEFSDFIKKNLVEVLWIIGFGLEKRAENKDISIAIQSSEKNVVLKITTENTSIYSSIINSLIKHKVVEKTTFIELLDESNLVDCGLIQDQEIFIKKISRLNTKMIYEQQKYNLLREESEGFSKLVFLLFEIKFNRNNIHKYIDKIFSLIGFFDLDPNRVMDITLTAFETDCNNLCFLEILKLLNINALPHVLGFKLSNLFANINYLSVCTINKENSESNQQNLPSEKTVNTQDEIISKRLSNKENCLFEVTAQLIKSKILDIKKIIPHLCPSLKETEEIFNKNVNESQKVYLTLQSRISKDLKVLSGNFLNLASLNKDSINSQENVTSTNMPNYFSNFPEYVNEILISFNNNQFYKLLKYLIKVKSWENCDLVFSILENFYDPLGSSELVMEVCNVLNEMIIPLYEKEGLSTKLKINKNDLIPTNISIDLNVNNLNNLSVNKNLPFLSEKKKNFSLVDEIISEDKEEKDFFNSPEDFLIRLPKILRYITYGISYDQILFQKILRLIKSYQNLIIPKKSTNYSNKSPIINEYQSIIKELICKVFLPAISIIDPTPSLLNDLWGIINLFDYNIRYRIYQYCQSVSYTTHPLLFLKHSIINRETSKWQNTFSKENQKSHGRILAILTNSNPVIIFDKIIKPLTSYDNQIDVIIKALAFSSNISYDVVSYVICKTLVDPTKEKIDTNFGDVNNWFKNFCYFAGCFYKEYQNTDFSAIFNYLLNQLKNKNQNCYIEFLIMKEIIEKMSMIFTQETLDESQVQSSFGGIYLYLEAMDMVKEYKNLEKPIQNLLKFFVGNSFSNDDEKLQIVSKVNKFLISASKNGNHQKSFEVLKESNLLNFSETKSVPQIQNFNEEDNEDFESGININNLPQFISKSKMDIDGQIETISNFQGNYFGTSNNKISFVFILLMLLGIRRTSIIFNSNYSQTKLLGYLYDKIQFVFIQLMQFLTTHLEREEYKRILPSHTLDNYIITYKCTPEVVFYLVRNSLRPIYEMEEAEYNMWIYQFSQVLNEHFKMNSDYFEDNFDPIFINKKKFMGDTYKNIWNYITPELYFIFSAMQLKDIFLPKLRYESEIEKNQKKINKLLEDNSNKTISEYQIRKNKKEISKLETGISNLKKEMTYFTKHQENIAKFIEKKNTSLLADIIHDNKRDISRIFIQSCLYPRLIFSSTEALYASKMVILLIDKKIQNINYFDIIQKFIKFLLPCIVTVTEFEALNIGYFLLEFLKSVKHWQDEKVWQDFCYSNPCFSRNLNVNTPCSVEHSEFKKVNMCLLNKMKEAFINILKYDDYMSCRNVIIVLNSIISVYPTTKEIGNGFIQAINEAIERFAAYENLLLMMRRYRDIIITKLPNLPFESPDQEKKIENNYQPNRERKRSKHRERGRSKEGRK